MTRDELVEQIQITVKHEIGHFLGMDEEEVERLGLAERAVGLADRLAAFRDVARFSTAPPRCSRTESDGLTLERGTPLCVAFPTTTEALCAVVRACKRRGRSLRAARRGHRTLGGATPISGGVVIECSRMNKILEIDATNAPRPCSPGWSTSISPRPCALSASTTRRIPRVSRLHDRRERRREQRRSPYTEVRHHEPARARARGRAPRRGGRAARSPRRHAHGFDLRGRLRRLGGTLGITSAVTVRLVPQPESVRNVASGQLSRRSSPRAKRCRRSSACAASCPRPSRSWTTARSRRSRRRCLRGRLSADARACCWFEVDG